MFHELTTVISDSELRLTLLELPHLSMTASAALEPTPVIISHAVVLVGNVMPRCDCQEQNFLSKYIHYTMSFTFLHRAPPRDTSKPSAPWCRHLSHSVKPRLLAYYNARTYDIPTNRVTSVCLYKAFLVSSLPVQPEWPLKKSDINLSNRNIPAPSHRQKTTKESEGRQITFEQSLRKVTEGPCLQDYLVCLDRDPVRKLSLTTWTRHKEHWQNNFFFPPRQPTRKSQ